MRRIEENGSQWQFPFVLYMPEDMPEECPLIIQLHGAGEVGNGGSELYKVEVHGLPKCIAGGAEFPCMLVFPQCPEDSFWIAEVPNILRFIQQLEEKYAIDSNRIYLTGLSMGGYGTWITASRAPKKFAAIAPVCGGGMPWKASALDMPVWAWHGSEDDVVAPWETLRMVHAIRQARPNDENIKMTIVDGVGHDVWNQAYTNELVNWLLKHHR